MAGISVGGVLPIVSLADMQEEERKQAELTNNTPIIQSLAAHVKECWTTARMAKQITVEERMLKSLRQKRGEYDPEILEEINKTGGSAIYMGLSGYKHRSATSWMRDVLLGTRDEKPWYIEPTPIPDLQEADKAQIKQEAIGEAMQIENSMQMPVTPQMMYDIVQRIKDRVQQDTITVAKQKAAKMEVKMEDQLVEGGFQKALSEFIDDVAAFPSAFLKGPVIRKRPKLVFGPNGEVTTQDDLKLEWERVDPFMIYPAPHSAEIDDGYLIERHHLTRGDLNALKGVPGYKDAAIDAVLDEYGRGGLKDWIWIDTAKATAEGKSTIHVMSGKDTIDALQFWGSVQGKLLKEWGLEEITDEMAEYNVEVWLIGNWVIKATINPDLLGRKPYYKASYEEVPGAFWGNSVMDLVRDCQTMCNTAARALANNMGIASGPQAVVNVDRLPDGEDITQMYPWKIWQTTNDPMGSTAKPIDFFAPPIMAGELMQIYERFSVISDNVSGIPRYMTGESAGTSGTAAGTASGMSMLMGNASKAMKQVIANIDVAMQDLIERLYYHNMRYSEDNDLKGDVTIIAHGANALMVKEQAQVRRNEFLQIVLSSPQVFELVGMEGLAELLRQSAGGLEMDTDKIIPPEPVIRAREQQRQMMQQAMMAQQAQQPQQTGKRQKVGGGQQLTNGAPVTNNFNNSNRG